MPKGSAGIVMDRLPGFAQAVEHLAQLGHRSACFLHTSHDVIYPHRRLKPYQKFCWQHRIRFRSETLPSHTPENRGEATFTAVRKILAESRPPTAWLCGDDETALGAVSAIRSAGLEVPRDFSVIGFNDLPSSKACWPPLTTIHQPREELPEAAVDMLDRMIRGDSTSPTQHRINCYLVIRGSTGPAPVKQS